jgi:hypothetical protein
VKTEDLVDVLEEIVGDRTVRDVMFAEVFGDLSDTALATLVAFVAGERPEPTPAFVAPVATFVRASDGGLTVPPEWDDDELDRREAQRILAAKKALEERRDPTEPLKLQDQKGLELRGVVLP